MSKVIIKRNDFDEYEVPTSRDITTMTIYYTDDKDDAISTAEDVWGEDVTILFRSGSYD